MHAVGGVDLEARAAILLHHFIDARRAITLGGLGVKQQVAPDGNGGILEFQMRRLVSSCAVAEIKTELMRSNVSTPSGRG